MGLLRKRGEKIFCHPLLWGALDPPALPLATPLRKDHTMRKKFRGQGQGKTQMFLNLFRLAPMEKLLASLVQAF